MTGFELQTSEVGSNRSTNWATTTAPTADLCLNNVQFSVTQSHLRTYT